MTRHNVRDARGRYAKPALGRDKESLVADAIGCGMVLFVVGMVFVLGWLLVPILESW